MSSGIRRASNLQQSHFHHIITTISSPTHPTLPLLFSRAAKKSSSDTFGTRSWETNQSTAILAKIIFKYIEVRKRNQAVALNVPYLAIICNLNMVVGYCDSIGAKNYKVWIAATFSDWISYKLTRIAPHREHCFIYYRNAQKEGDNRRTKRMDVRIKREKKWIRVTMPYIKACVNWGLQHHPK